MKLDCEVKKVSNSGDTLNVTFRGRQAKDAGWRRDGEQSIEIACTDKMKRVFYLGRKVTITVHAR